MFLIVHCNYTPNLISFLQFINGKNVEIIDNRMMSDMMMSVIGKATTAVSHYRTDYDQLCMYIRDQLDIQYGRHWQCVASIYPYGSYFWFLPQRYIKLQVDGITISVFKCD